MNYFILTDNQQQGPFTIDELRRRAITQETLVWAEGMPQWTPAWQVEELKPLFFGQPSAGATPPPPPPSAGGPQPGQAPQRPAQPDPQPAPKKKKGRRWLHAAIAAVAVILFLLALTNPGKAEHRQAIMRKLDAATEQAANVSDPMARAVMRSIFGGGQGVVGGMVRQLVDESLEYHNYVFFSTTTLHSDLLGGDIRCSTGFLGHVSAVSLGNILPEIITRQLGGGSGGGDGTQPDREEETTTQTTQDADGNQTTVTTKTVRHNGVTIDSLTRKVTNSIADEVAKKVKSEVRQETDSATASGIDGIVNAVVDFIKGL